MLLLRINSLPSSSSFHFRIFPTSNIQSPPIVTPRFTIRKAKLSRESTNFYVSRATEIQSFLRTTKFRVEKIPPRMTRCLGWRQEATKIRDRSRAKLQQRRTWSRRPSASQPASQLASQPASQPVTQFLVLLGRSSPGISTDSPNCLRGMRSREKWTDLLLSFLSFLSFSFLASR